MFLSYIDIFSSYQYLGILYSNLVLCTQPWYSVLKPGTLYTNLVLCTQTWYSVHKPGTLLKPGTLYSIRVITKLPNSKQSYKGKVKTHKYINRQNQSTTGKL